MVPKGICILGSTGSIGTQTLEIVRLFPDRLKVRVLTAGRNSSLLIEQAREFVPDCVVIDDVSQYAAVKADLSALPTEVISGSDGILTAARWPDVDIVVTAIVGAAGLRATLAAAEEGKRIALANKETLVVAGGLINPLVASSGAEIIPIDSEHSAIFQCLIGEDIAAVEGLYLTASGGPFRTRPLETFDSITREEALRHPNWAMGNKITIDSATMMNKGLEIIEAYWLFGIDPDRIHVVVHPQSIVHSMVAFVDGSTKAQMGIPDMKVPIQYALSFPDRWSAAHDRVSWEDEINLQFDAPDLNKFPCLMLAYEALRSGGAAPAVLNAANETAVSLFLEERIRFVDIPGLLESALSELGDEACVTIDELLHVDTRTRIRVKELSRARVH